MKTVTVSMLLTLALCLIQDAASEDANQESCSEFRTLMKNGKLFCSQDKKSMKNPDEVLFINKCVKCKMILEEEVKYQKRARHLARDTRATAPGKLNCEDFKRRKSDGDFICPLDAPAVCGTDGKTYHSRCALCAENAKSRSQVDIKSEGECDSKNPEKDVCSDFRAYAKDGRLGCTRENDPVLGPDGRTHGNKCAMCAELFLKEAQENAKREGENRIRREAEKELCKEFESRVKSGRLYCTRESEPIRGPDGRMHGNKCALCAEIFMKLFSEEKSKAEKEQKNAEEKVKQKREIQQQCEEFQDRAKNGTLFCTRENNPTPGLDGKMHGNPCSMCQAFFQAEAEEKKKMEAQARNKRGSEKSSSYAICSKYQHNVRNGKLSCFEQKNPIRGPDGKEYLNACTMCQSFFKEEEKKKKRDELKNKRKSDNTTAFEKLCSQYRKSRKNGQLYCTRESDPMPGPDGKMHGNVCSMCAAFFDQEDKARAKAKREAMDTCSEFRDQVRSGTLACTRENDPVVGPDGKQHANKCAMCASIFQLEEEDKRNSDEEEKVNVPMENTKVKRALQDNCSEFRSLLQDGNLYCTRENDPVRGPDGRTHGNKCAMCKEVFKQENEVKERKEGDNERITSGHGPNGGKSNSKDYCAEFRGRMKDGHLSCTRERDPVRDADGKSYNNKCDMCKELLEKEAKEKHKYSGSRSNETETAGQDVCDQFRSQMKNGKLLCTRESEPVRGPDGKKHGNKCAMCKGKLEREAAQKKKKEEEEKRNIGGKNNGEKDECHEFRSLQQNGKLICTRENSPTRGPDGKMHPNKCAMCQSIFDREARERSRNNEDNSRSQPSNQAKDECRDVQNEAEGANIRQFGSSSASIASISAGSSSPESKEISKSSLSTPPTNKGEKKALEEAKHQENSSHIRASENESSLESSISTLNSEMCKHYRLLPRMGYLCPKNLQPVCGDDGQTYNNPCMLCHENLMRQTNTQIRSKGKCEESGPPEAAPADTPKSDK